MASNLRYYNEPEVKIEIDKILYKMASVFANCGQDSTLKEIKEAYRKEWAMMDEIAKIDPEFAKVIRPYNEQEWKRNTTK
jgi:hypothetical protein